LTGYLNLTFHMDRRHRIADRSPDILFILKLFHLVLDVLLDGSINDWQQKDEARPHLANVPAKPEDGQPLVFRHHPYRTGQDEDDQKQAAYERDDCYFD
jgi:hypothetical protein